jgi:hypothetical protein
MSTGFIQDSLLPIALQLAFLLAIPIAGEAADLEGFSDAVFQAANPQSGGDASSWRIRFATSAPNFDPRGRVDFASWDSDLLLEVSSQGGPSPASGEPPLASIMPRGATGGETAWSSTAPATLTLTFKAPFVLDLITLETPDMEKGFSDFEIALKKSPEQPWVPLHILAATVTTVLGEREFCHWELEPKAISVRVLSVCLRQGSILDPDRVALRQLRVWGRKLE